MKTANELLFVGTRLEGAKLINRAQIIAIDADGKEYVFNGMADVTKECGICMKELSCVIRRHEKGKGSGILEGLAWCRASNEDAKKRLHEWIDKNCK